MLAKLAYKTIVQNSVKKQRLNAARARGARQIQTVNAFYTKTFALTFMASLHVMLLWTNAATVMRFATVIF